MVKVIALLKRKDGMTMDEFKRFWVYEHSKLSMQLPGLRGYRINVAIPYQPDGGEPVYDGTAELWFDSIEEMEAAFASDIGQEGGADADNNLASLRLHLYTEEFNIVPGPHISEQG